jgi:membrane protein
MAGFVRESWALIKGALEGWLEDNGPRMAAALAFYTTFSLGPALLIGLGVAGAFVDSSTAKSVLLDKVKELVTPETSVYISSVLDSLWLDLSSRHLPIIGIAIALVAATAVFAELQSSLNTIWDAKPKRGGGFLNVIYRRAISFVFVVGMGVLILVSVVASAVLSAIDQFMADTVPISSYLLDRLGMMIDFAMIPLLLVLAYKLIPDAEVSWRNALVGSVVGTLLFLIGKSIFGMYLGFTTLPTIYGAAGSFIILLLWVYYSAQVFLFGAELSKEHAKRYSQHLPTRENTVESRIEN